MTEEEQKRIFSANLTKYIKLSGQSQREIADHIGVSPQTFNSWCKSVALPRMGKVQALADYFEINKSDLIDSPPMFKAVSAIAINVLGSVPAGVPLDEISDIVDQEAIPLSLIEDGSRYLGYKLNDDTLYPKYIKEDTLILKLQGDCDSGQDCMVQVAGDSATFQKVIKNQGCTILQPLDSTRQAKVYSDSEQDSFQILGVVSEVRRKVSP